MDGHKPVQVLSAKAAASAVVLILLETALNGSWYWDKPGGTHLELATHQTQA
jgi:hypothetical protein